MILQNYHDSLDSFVCTTKTLVVDTDRFVDDFCDRLLKLKTHHFD